MFKKPEAKRPNGHKLPQMLWWLLGVGIAAAIAIGLWLYGRYDAGYFRRQADAGTPVAREPTAARATIAHHTPTVLFTEREVTVEVQITTEIERTVIVEITATPEPSTGGYESGGLCGQVEAPCTYVVEAGDSWPSLANKTAFGDFCRWPEIADLNREPDGNYSRLSPEDAIFIPAPAPRGTYRPRMRTEEGEYEFIVECSASSGLPCIYTMEEGIYGNRYAAVAEIVYGEARLALVITNANKESDCSGNPIPLQPGLRIVIPRRPSE